MDLAWPFTLDGAGRATTSSHAEHIRELIEQLLFTVSGERVCRPDFGCGLLQLLFSTNSLEVSMTLRYSIQTAINRWLAGRITLHSVEVTADDNLLVVTLEYALLPSGELQAARFERADTSGLMALGSAARGLGW